MSTVVEELQKIHEGMLSTWSEYKASLEERWDAEVAKLGEASGETQEMFAKLDARLDSQTDEFNARLQKLRLDDDRTDGGPSAHRKAYVKALRSGVGSLDDTERSLLKATDGHFDIKAAMAFSDDTSGGFLAEDDVVKEIIKGVVEYSPIRELANVRTTTRNSVKAPKRTAVAGAVWAGEVEARTETTNPSYGKEELSTRELSAMADISLQDLEDAGVDLEALIYGEFSEQFGVSEGAAFVSGDGLDGKPEGFLTAADTGYLGSNGVETITSASNDVLVGDDYISLFYGLKEAYARKAVWVQRRATTAVARKLKDVTSGQYIWQPGLATLAPATILGQPYVEAIDMPAVANGALAVAFGDWKKAYWIVDRIQIDTLRDPYTQRGNGFVRFWARKRVGGQVVLPEALKLLEIQ